MNIRLLGTGGADGIPGFYEDNPVSRFARVHGGRDVRSRASALIDGHIKIDLGPDTQWQMVREGLKVSDWTALVFTHGHDDHFSVSEIQYSLEPFCANDHLPYVIYGNAYVVDSIWARYPHWPLELVVTRSFEPFQHMDTRVTPIHAFHDPSQDCHNLVFERDGKAFLYATDTGVWEEQTWEFLKDFRLDGLVIECSDGLCDSGYEGHLDVVELAHVLARLRKQGSLRDGAPVFTTHHTCQGFATHAQLETALAPIGAAPGFDGLVIDL